MAEESAAALATNRKRRGVVRASLTRLEGRLADLEGKRERSEADRLIAQQLAIKVSSLDADFKSHHYAIIDLVPEEALATEQVILDEHDDRITDFTVRLGQIVSEPDRSARIRTASSAHDHLSRRLTRVEKSLQAIVDAINPLTTDSSVDTCLLQQQDDQISRLQAELTVISRDILLLDDCEDMSEKESSLNKVAFDTRVKIKRLLQTPSKTAPTASEGGVKLPKLDVPTFDGNLISWKTFWEQFSISVHDRASLSDAEKLAYLKHAVKDGSAKHVVEGLSGTGEHYQEAIDCLRTRFDRPRLIHQAHVRAVVEAPALKDGNGRELRRLHDTVTQHLRALKSMDEEPSGSFVTSLLELKLDTTTIFEWRKHTQESTTVPHYNALLEFIHLRAQASESSVADLHKKRSHDVSNVRKGSAPRSFTAYTAALDDTCTVCKAGKHPLFACPSFKSLPHDQMLSIVKAGKICLNCLKRGHFLKQCPSTQRCRQCQKPHHTLLHIEERRDDRESSSGSMRNPPLSLEAPAFSPPPNPRTLVSNMAQSVSQATQVLLMTCRVLVLAPNGVTMQCRALLDSASSASFVSERVAQRLRLSRSKHFAQVTGIGGIAHQSSSLSCVRFSIAPIQSSVSLTEVEAVVLPKVTSNLPLQPLTLLPSWQHLSGIRLADPDFGTPGTVDMILGIDVFNEALLHGRRSGPRGSPSAFETTFGWVLAGAVSNTQSSSRVVSHFVSVVSSDDLLQKFWEVEQFTEDRKPLSKEEKMAVDHFKSTHWRDEAGRFVVPLPKKPDVQPLGESRSYAVKRFVSLERSLHSRNQFHALDDVIQEYFHMGHAEPVPSKDADRPQEEVFYLPVQAVVKASSTTTKVRAVFDGSAKSASGVSINDQLIVGPTVHSSLVNVLLRFRMYRIALTADVSRMYRAVLIPEDQRDLHRFVWRQNPSATLRDYRMTRVTFGISSSSFVANMALKQIAIDHAHKYPLAASAVHNSFYVDDGLTGADTPEEAAKLQQQLQDLFASGGFLLRKWKSSHPSVLQHLSPELLDVQTSQPLPDDDDFAKALGVEWSTRLDCFRLTVSELPTLEVLTKRALISDIARTYDVLGWFAPCVIVVKVLLQHLWEAKVEWDDPVPEDIQARWERWRSELPMLSTRCIPRCYFPKDARVQSLQLHGYSDASEVAYSAAVYLRSVSDLGSVHVSLVISKTKVAPIRRITIPRLELCGASLLASVLNHLKQLFSIPLSSVYAWTDSTVVLAWLSGSPRRHDVFVGNRISKIMDLIPPDRWGHVSGSDNPADVASRGVYPSELLEHPLWWDGPEWLWRSEEAWPKYADSGPRQAHSPEEEAICFHTLPVSPTGLSLLEHYSSFTTIKRITAWVLRFVHNSKHGRNSGVLRTGSLSVVELTLAEELWLRVAQQSSFTEEISSLRKKAELPKASPLLPLHPFLDDSGLVRVGGRGKLSTLSYAMRHPIVLPAKHPVTKLIVHAEHLRLVHGGPTLMAASLSRKFHILGSRRLIRTVCRGCIICRRVMARPYPQELGQLPSDRLRPGTVFNVVGVDYAGPLLIKTGSTRKPTIQKAYLCVFVSFAVKAVHLELVSDLTSQAFLAALRRFVARRGLPSTLWSDNGKNFVGAARELKELFQFLAESRTQEVISSFCSSNGIQWKFIPEHAPHFGGLWEAAVKSAKTHLKKVVGQVKLSFEELATVLTQIEACLNSRPLTPLPCSDDGYDVLTPGHFFVGRPLRALPDPESSYQPMSVLRRWNLCQTLVRHFWRRWSSEYVLFLRRYAKWNHPSRNLQVGDLVCVHEDGLVPTSWPIARIESIRPGKDGRVRVVTVKTPHGTYTRPVTKVALLLPTD